ncbi:MAG TPA: hypothetical protein PKY96_05485 [Flavobacteriales bacterium]|nr:hypothetical protein [Flavobacteriales bacterium]
MSTMFFANADMNAIPDHYEGTIHMVFLIAQDPDMKGDSLPWISR